MPGPSEFFIRAYVVLEPEQTRELLDRYQWIESTGDQIPRPIQQLGEGFPQFDGPCWRSDSLMRSLPSMTSYCGGTILLQPEKNILYLDLQNL